MYDECKVQQYNKVAEDLERVAFNRICEASLHRFELSLEGRAKGKPRREGRAKADKDTILLVQQ